MRMEFYGSDCRFGIVIGDCERLAPWGSAAIENVGPVPNEGRDELRGFILNCDLTGAEDGSLRDVSRGYATS
jgi:hypothetical protein